jgi:hypothetical protein
VRPWEQVICLGTERAYGKFRHAPLALFNTWVSRQVSVVPLIVACLRAATIHPEPRVPRPQIGHYTTKQTAARHSAAAVTAGEVAGHCIGQPPER